MPEQHEIESDDEVYFLKPVNEYNIVEKIKAANKELFDEAQNDVKMDGSADSSSSSTTSTRKVTFAENLENYEPCDGESLEAAEAEGEAEEDSLHAKLAAGFNFAAIDEEEPNEEDNQQQQQEDEEQPETTEDHVEETQPETEAEHDADDIVNKELIEDVVEEICEEIDGMEVNTEELEDQDEDELASSNARRMMVKQATFDHDGQEDNKSMSNLLLSDCEEDFQLPPDEEDISELDNPDSAALDLQNCDEDDDLSIIVASYIQEDEYDNASFLSDIHQSNCRTTTVRSFSGQRKHRNMSLSKRFSFRRRKNVANTTNASDATNCQPPELTDLKFNYKTCCEYKHSEQEKLPKYTGYLSEYGLSRDQLAKREQQLQRKQTYAMQHALNCSEKEMQKMEDNERAFTKWLKNKMRYPINKTRNMFDVKVMRGRKRNSTGN